MWVPPSQYMGRWPIPGKHFLDPGIWFKFLLISFSVNTHLLAHSSTDQKAGWAQLRSMLRLPPGWNPDVFSGGLILRLRERIAWAHSGCWEILAPCGCKTEAPTFLVEVSQDLLSNLKKPFTFLLRCLPPSSHHHLHTFGKPPGTLRMRASCQGN